MHLIETMVSSGKADLGKMFPFAETVLASSYKTIFCCEFLGVRRIFSSHPIRHSSIFCLPLLLFLVSLGFLDPFLVCLTGRDHFHKKNSTAGKTWHWKETPQLLSRAKWITLRGPMWIFSFGSSDVDVNLLLC